ncbi:MAG: hypothetical protein PPHEMADMSA_6408 [uncultured Paraburkholderia sp.]|nr:MAG: hypothetical protein PPHEMADMSA_6408 [uncultured Paraburkholderia sp.]
MIRRYCAFGLEYKDNDRFTHDWVTLLPGLGFAYSSTVHSVTERKPFELWLGYVPNSPAQILNNKLPKLELHPGVKSFLQMQQLCRKHAQNCIEKAFEYEKKRWDKSHKESTFKEGDEVLISTVHFNLQGNNKLKDPFVGPFVVKRMIGNNAVEVMLYAPYDRKHPVFPISLLKPYNSNNDLFPKRRGRPKKNPQEITEIAEIDKILNDRIITSERGTEYLLRYKGKSSEYDAWIPGKEISNFSTLLKKYKKKKS